MALEVDGTETEAELAAVSRLSPIVVLLATKPGVSRLHSSRRVFDALQRHAITAPVVHDMAFPAGAARDEIVITTGSLVGGLLVDGLGDGAMI
jgi:(E)-4-hydroxy-3-methylbut-2-enyl-diphosphate synthase